MGSRHLHTKNQLARMRATSGLTQAELAARAGVTRQAIGGIEAGRHATTVEIGLRLARALGCRVEDIFGLAPGPGRERAIAPLSEVTTGPMRVALSRVGDQLVARPLRQLGDHRLATVAADAMAISLGGDGAPIGATDAHRQADDRGWPDDELEPADHGDGQIRSVRVDRFAPPGVGAARPCLFLVGCDPALGLLASHVSRRPGTGGALWFQANNSAASRQLGAGLAHVAGVHAPPVDARPGVGGDGGWATIRMCSWEMGWALRPTGPGHAANEPVVSLLTDGGHRVANRE
ncbi:MAG: helix-turn-helix domain-containing protein, partial [Acidimicrobiales bacterium]